MVIDSFKLDSRLVGDEYNILHCSYLYLDGFLSQCWVQPNTLKMGVVPACMVVRMKEGARNITG